MTTSTKAVDAPLDYDPDDAAATRGSYRWFPFINIFKSPELEREFLADYYGHRGNLYMFFAALLGAFLQFQFVFTDDNPDDPVWMMSTLLSAGFALVITPLYILPPFVQRKWLFEIVEIVSLLFAEVRNGIRITVLEDRNRHTRLSFGEDSAFLKLILVLLYRPRVATVVMPVEIVSSILFSIYRPLIPLPNTDMRAVPVVLMYWFCSLMTIAFTAGINRTRRELFLQNRRRRATRDLVLAANERRLKLLENILPAGLVRRIQESAKMGAAEEPPEVAVALIDDDAHENIGEVLPEVVPAAPATIFRSVVETYEMGTLIQSDFVGFTKYASETSAREVTTLLNLLFSFFDQLTDSLRGLEKVKTLGDAFVAFGETLQDSSASTVALGIGILESVRTVNREMGQEFRCRVGACGAPLFLCAYGSREKIAFDVFGEGTRIAAEMEQSAEVDTIQVCPALMAAATERHCKIEKSASGTNGVIRLPAGVGIDEALPDLLQDADLRLDLLRSLRACCEKYFPKSGGSEERRKQELTAAFSLIDHVIGYSGSVATESAITGSVATGAGSVGGGVEYLGRTRKKDRFCPEKCSCKSDFGLIYPLFIFCSCKKELESYNRAFERASFSKIALLGFWMVFNMLMLVCFLFVDMAYIYETVRPFCLASFTAVVILGLSFIVVLIPQVRANFWVYQAILLVNLLILKVQLITLALEEDPLLGPFIFIYIFQSMVSASWAPGLHLYARILSVVIDLGIVFASLSFILEYITDPVVMETTVFSYTQTFVSILICFLFAALTIEANVKRGWNSTLRLTSAIRRLKAEKSLNTDLVYTVLPKRIARQFLRDRFRNFSMNCSRSFVCFVKLKNFSSKLDASNIRGAVQFLAGLFARFDLVLQGKSFLPIKRIQESYMWLSLQYPSGEAPNVLVAALQVVEAFKECLAEACSDLDALSWREDSGDITLQISLAHGPLGAGVLGCQKFLFDCFGDVVNVSARLLPLSTEQKVAVSYENIESCLSEVVEVKDIGTHDIKGKGETRCCVLSLKDEDDVDSVVQIVDEDPESERGS